MDFPPVSSQGWADKAWLILTGALGLWAANLIRLFLYRKKPQFDNAKTDAETENLRIDGSIKASDQILRLMDRMNRIEAEAEASAREAVSTAKFYRGQVEYFEQLDLIYRKRMHAVNGEWSRLILGLRMLEMELSKVTGKPIEPFEVKTYDEVIQEFPLPETMREEC